MVQEYGQVMVDEYYPNVIQLVRRLLHVLPVLEEQVLSKTSTRGKAQYPLNIRLVILPLCLLLLQSPKGLFHQCIYWLYPLMP